MADNRVFGVDLNPVAVELAQISLWLNTIYEGHTIPWFGAQLAVGNSLIGARRQVFTREQIVGKERAWLEGVPERVRPGEVRPEGAVYHWLLPDSGMANYTDRAVKQMTGDATKRIGQWRREFTARFTEGDAKALERLSAAADKLWKKHAEDLRSIRVRTAPAFPIFGQEDNPAFRLRGEASTTQRRNEVWRGFCIRARGPAPMSGSSWPWITGVVWLCVDRNVRWQYAWRTASRRSCWLSKELI